MGHHQATLDSCWETTTLYTYLLLYFLFTSYDVPRGTSIKALGHIGVLCGSKAVYVALIFVLLNVFISACKCHKLGKTEEIGLEVKL
jgi:succinate-acetate transporter protein